MSDFCHLHLHTEYSVLDGVGTSKQYSYRAREAGQTHIAITNHGNIDGILDHQKQCGISGVKPLAGCELYIVPDMYIKVKGEKRYHVTVLVENQVGWQNLLKLLTIANLEGFYHRPRVDLGTLQQHLEGLVVLTGCSLSFLNMPGARKYLRNFVDVLGPERVYLEVMPHQLDEQLAINEKCLALRKHYGLRLVATNDCHYPSNRAAFYQEVLLAIQSRKKMADKDRWRFSVDGFYLKTREEMVTSFKALGGLSPKQLAESLESTMIVAEMCEGFRVGKQEPQLPSIGFFPERKDGRNISDLEKIKEIVQSGFESRTLQKDDGWLLRYRSRIEEELALISKAKFERYFLVVWDLINWCRNNGILTGPGRGSVGGSLVAYLMGITDVDPIKYDLSFARFISPDRQDLPDIDMDFEDHKRHLVKKYLQDKYGEFNVAGLSTFMQMKGRGVITDVSRVYDVPLVEVKIATKAVDNAVSENQVKEAFERDIFAMRFKHKYPEVAEIAEGLEGQIRGCISGDCRLTLPKKSGEVGIRVKKIKHLYKENYRGKARAYDLSKHILFFDDVIDIWPVGVKRVFDLSVGGSKKIRLTADHRLLTKSGWKEAENIQIGELVATNGVPWNKGLKGAQVAWNKGLKGSQVPWNKGLTKDDHPGVAIHSERMKENNPSKLEQVKKLTSERSLKHGGYSIPPRYKAKHPVCEVCGVRKTEEVHHIDIDHYNNDESNLLAVCSKCHHEIHWSLSDQNLHEINPLRTVGWSKVASFEFAGEEMVYDIEMKSSNQNFVCNKIIAHNCGQHAAAVCVSSVDLREGLNCNLAIRSGQIVANWDKDNAEYMGLIKLDILGLSALSVLQSAKEMIQKNHGVEIDFNAIPLDDKKVYREINKGNTVGAFQIGARGLSKFCQELGVDDFDLLVAATALYRPGPLHSGMAEQFIKIKNGDAPVKKLTPGYDRITEDTFGIIVYQEQVMAIINQMSGIDMATCDKIRKLMAKSKGEEAINKYKEQFLEGCVVNGSCDKRLANLIWKTLVTFGSYGFNKCLTGDTILTRASGNQYQPAQVTVKELFDAQRSKTEWGQKFRKQGVQVLQMDDDARIRPGKLKNVYYSGQQEVFKITTNSGKSIKVTRNHKLLTTNGYEEVSAIEVGSFLVCQGDKEERIKLGQAALGRGKSYKGKGWQSGQSNICFIDGKTEQFKKAKSQVSIRSGNKCESCSVQNNGDKHFFEFAHINSLESFNGDYSKYHHCSNIKHLCNSCHKKLDYQIGVRKKRWSKGLPVIVEQVVLIESQGFQRTYDVEMETEAHNFIANGIVSHNSHSVEYSLITIWDMWLKTYYPGEFIAATLTHGGKDKCSEYMKEAGRLGLEVRLPKIGISHSTDWRIDTDRNLFAPFSAVGGIGEATAEAIAKYNPAAQKQHGFFLAAKQVSGKIPGVNKTVIEKLEKMGSFEPVGEISRAERALVKELLA